MLSWNEPGAKVRYVAKPKQRMTEMGRGSAIMLYCRDERKKSESVGAKRARLEVEVAGTCILLPYEKSVE